jgi:hypothetical protein
MRLIDADALIETVKNAIYDYWNFGSGGYYLAEDVIEDIELAPTINAVSIEQYDELREDFVDFVCSGTSNLAPYCKNRCDDCVDHHGWCTYKECKGFNPDGRGREEDGK